jgi:hypothetical protein
VNPQDNTHVKKISDKISDEVQCDMNNNLVNRSEIDRLEDAFVNALFKLEQATTNNKNEIIGHMKSLSMPNDRILGKFVRIQQKFELQHLFPSYLWTEVHN